VALVVRRLWRLQRPSTVARVLQVRRVAEEVQ